MQQKPQHWVFDRIIYEYMPPMIFTKYIPGQHEPSELNTAKVELEAMLK
jgi:hypothetical protein